MLTKNRAIQFVAFDRRSDQQTTTGDSARRRGCAGRMQVRPIVFALWCGVVWMSPAIAQEDGRGAGPVFERDVRPILQSRCLKCHGEERRKAELNLSSRHGLLKGSESGEVLAAGQPDDSLLFQMIDDGLMPPDDSEPLSDEQIETIRRWIASGARFANSGRENDLPAVTQHDVIPIMLRRCTMCHGPEFRMGGLDLRTRSAMLAGGDSGTSLVAGDADGSPIVQRVIQGACPPRQALGQAGIEPMTSDELDTLRKWIAAGAPETRSKLDVAGSEPDPLVSDEDRQFWSFQPPKKGSPPRIVDFQSVRNPIDAFLLAKLEENELTFSPQAARLTLLRRATFDLTGLPPDPQDVQEFLSDESPASYERLIDRLLSSPRYGGRWARFWLDLAGYADSEGKRNADTVRPWAWRYRDYVIRSFNADKPYDQFLLEQIAGDELVDFSDADSVTEETIETLVATGFLRMAPDGTAANPVNRISDRIEVIADEVDVVSRGVMGLTMKCARCHSHKYDPIPQRDYYRFVAIFKGAYDEYDWLVPQPFGNQWEKAGHRFLTVVLPDERREIESHNRDVNRRIERLRKQLKQARDDKHKAFAKKLEKQIKQLESQRKELPKIRALWDRGRPSPTYVYRRGDETQPVRLVRPGVPSALTDGRIPFDVQPSAQAGEKTGRRLAFAGWLTRPDHPLTARVIVNRVWKHHFGTGIVKSLDNFGALGTPPTHPQLLDWLAVDFVEHGWSIKHLHRLIMTSNAYRQSSVIEPRHEEFDPENHLLSRMPMRRMSAEEVRDSILRVAGRLREQPFGQPDPVEARKDGLVTSKSLDGQWRRSIYVRQRRKEMPTILETFDLPQMNPNCLERMQSTVVSQPLILLNNKMIHELAGSLAERIEREVGCDPHRQVERAWLVALGRPATPEERQLGLSALATLQREWEKSLAAESSSSAEQASRRALADYCHALLNSAAFLYID